MDNSQSDELKAVKDFSMVAVYGSPRQGSNTDTLLNRFLEGAVDCRRLDQDNLKIEKIYTRDLKIEPCRGCGNCLKTGECIIQDEMQALYAMIIDCNLLLIASPVFFTTVTGSLKSFIDRFQRFWALKYELKKKIIVKPNRRGILISTAGSDSENIFDCIKKVIRALFDILYMEYLCEFLFNNIDKKGDIFNNPEALNKIYDYGRKGSFL